ncbi:hypothetical protein BGZ72_009113 [Mortierella alpina]|nr:hypothetical protein BGZ72_009113 [Mortierella alpina]
MASPIAMSIPSQNAFTRPTEPVDVCGTVIGIDFTEDEFSAGFVNATNQVELFRNKDGDTYTPCYVRIIDFPEDSTRTVLVGKEALMRPLDAREKKLANAMTEALTKYRQENPVRNYSVPDIHFQFWPDLAYGLGMFRSTNLQEEYWRFRPSVFLLTKDGAMVVGEEWENVSPRRFGGDGSGNGTGQCPGPSDEALEYMRRIREKTYLQKVTVAGLLMGHAKEMAEKRLRENVKFAVLTVPTPVDMPHGTMVAGTPTPPALYTEGLVRGGLHPLRVLEQSEAAVLAYEPQLVKAERAAGGRPQTIVFYYLNVFGEGIVVFETNRDPAEEDFLRLKTVAKYHFYQSVRQRMAKAMARLVYERYTDGSFRTLDSPRDDCEDCPWDQYTDDSNHKAETMRFLETTIQELPHQVEAWSTDDPEDDAKEERLFVSKMDYVVLTRKEWKDFEKAWLKTHFGAMLNRAYEKSGVEVEARPQRIDHFLILDESRHRHRSSSIMREVLGGSAELNELLDPAIKREFGQAVSHGAARVADYLTKRSSQRSCQQ